MTTIYLYSFLYTVYA